MVLIVLIVVIVIAVTRQPESCLAVASQPLTLQVQVGVVPLSLRHLPHALEQLQGLHTHAAAAAAAAEAPGLVTQQRQGTGH